MGIFDRWFKKEKALEARAAGALEERVAKLANDDSSNALISTGNAPPKAGARELLEAYSDVPALRVVVQRIAQSVASIKWTAYHPDTKNSVETRGLWDCSAPSLQRNLESLDPIPFNHLIDAWTMGNAMLDGFACRQVMQTHYELLGEKIAQYQLDNLGNPIALWPLNPSWVEALPTDAQPFFRVRFPNGGTLNVPKEEMLYTRNPDPVNPYKRGTGLGFALRDELDTDEYMAAYIRAFFANSALPQGFVSIENATQEQLDRVARTMEASHRGVDRAHRLHFLNSKLDVQLTNKSLADLEVTPLRQGNKDYIREIFGIPPEIVGVIQNSNRSTIEAAEYYYAQWTLIPRLEQDRRMLQNEASKFNYDIVVGYESPLPRNRDYVHQVSTVAPWSVTRAEWRARQGLPTTPDDDVYFIPSGLVEVAVGEKLPPPASATLPARAHDDIESRAEIATRAKMAKKRNPLSRLTVDELNAAIESSPYDLEARLKKWWPKEMKQFAARSGSEELGLVTEPPKELTAAYMKKFGGDRIKDINKTTKGRIRKALADGITKDESLEETIERVRKAGMSPGRAKTIVTTEITQASSFAKSVAMKNVTQYHRWVAYKGARPTHAAANGQVVAIGKNFRVGGAVGPYPGAMSSVEESVNCKCDTVPVLDKKFTEAYEAKLDVLEKEAELKLLGKRSASDDAVEALEKAREKFKKIGADKTLAGIKFDQSVLQDPKARATLRKRLAQAREASHGHVSSALRRAINARNERRKAEWAEKLTKDLHQSVDVTINSVVSELKKLADQKGKAS